MQSFIALFIDIILRFYQTILKKLFFFVPFFGFHLFLYVEGQELVNQFQPGKKVIGENWFDLLRFVWYNVQEKANGEKIILVMSESDKVIPANGGGYIWKETIRNWQ